MSKRAEWGSDHDLILTPAEDPQTPPEEENPLIGCLMRECDHDYIEDCAEDATTLDVGRLARALRYVGLLEGGKVEIVGPDSLARDLAAAYLRPEVEANR